MLVLTREFRSDLFDSDSGLGGQEYSDPSIMKKWGSGSGGPKILRSQNFEEKKWNRIRF